MDRKYVPSREFKLDETGHVEVAFAQLNVVDRDADVTLPGAIPGKDVLIGAYGHTTWDGALPVGKGAIGEDGGWAVLRGSFWLDTSAGRETYLAVKNAGPLQEWSYGYVPLDVGYETRDGQPVRMLKKLDIFEVSPVLVGAGIGTHTRAIKAATPFTDLPLGDRSAPYQEAEAEARVRAWASSDGTGNKDTIDWAKYRRGFFWVDDGPAEDFGSYKLRFADVVDGTLTAMPRAIFAAAAVMQGARGGVDIPAADRDAVKAHIAKYYAKMAATFDDPELVPPWAKGDLPAGLTYADHLDRVLIEVTGLTERTSDLSAMRAKEGRVLSSATRERLSALMEAMRSAMGDLEMLLSETEPPKQRELRALQARILHDLAVANGVPMTS